MYLLLGFLILESLHPLGEFLSFLGSSGQLCLDSDLLMLVWFALILPGSLDIVDADIFISIILDDHVFGGTVVAVYVLRGNHLSRAGGRGL